VYGPDVLDRRLANLEEAAISQEARAMLPVLDAFSGEPGTLTAAALDEVRALGVSTEAIVDAFHVAYLFNIINRMADALDFEVGSEASFDSGARTLLGKRGYG
jgi:alkylhydroperoxidase family enzyme